MSKNLYSLGLMSGTSMDGIDASIIKSDGKQFVEIIDDIYLKYDDQLRSKLKKIVDICISKDEFKKQSKNINEIEKEITLCHAEICKSIIKKNKNINIDLIGFHGHTVLHKPQDGYSIQIGDSQLLSKLTNKTVVSNFRQNDILNGGQGAPLAPLYHRLILSKIKFNFPSAVINIGGIANITYIENKNKIISFDTGPGNYLLDAWVKVNSKMEFDDKGLLAKSGKLNEHILEKFLSNPYYKKKFPKSLDVKDFNLNDLSKLSLKDGCAALSMLTIKTICMAIHSFTKVPNVILFSGGGRKNEFIIENIKKRYGIRRYKIQEVIKPDQIILVQILKDERGQKGAALTTFISLAGKYSVLMPNTPRGGGISRKIINYDDRKKIRKILQEINIPTTMGLIVRTAGLNKTKNELNKDILNTIKTWEEIKVKTIESIAPSLVYEEGDIIKRAIRDIYDNNTNNIIVDGNEGYQKAKNFMKFLMPENVKKIKKYRGKIPLFHEAEIEKSLNRIFEPAIKLESGGYIVINPTEALVSIDVNSGQSIKEVNIEKTALKTNLEAAEEISRQIKIRDLSGLIVIDFIDMFSFYNKKTVERKLREKLKDDKARIQFGRIGNFGLLEMTRQRLRESSVKWNMVLSLDSFALKIVKKGEELAFSNKAKVVNINVPSKVKTYIDENLAKEIAHFKKKYKIEINIISDVQLSIPEYKINLLNKNKKIIKKMENLEKLEKNFTNKNYDRKNFIDKANNKNFKMRGKFKKKFRYNPKIKRNNFEKKKTASY